MRHPGVAGPDGPANILAGLQAAVSPQLRDLGCVVMFADEIHAARFVRKTDATHLAAFSSPSAEPVGRIVEGEPRAPGVSPARQVSRSGRGATRPAGTMEHRAGYNRHAGTSCRLDLMDRRAGRTISQPGNVT